MDQSNKTTVRRVFYMYYFYKGKKERSAEYPTLKAFYDKCGAWCDAHPFDWVLCHRDIRDVAR